MIPTLLALNYINGGLRTNPDIWGTDDVSASIMLVTNEFVPSKMITRADLTEATFDGGTRKDVPQGPQVFILDDQSGRQGIKVREPVGGYSWVCTVAPDVPQIVYGWALTIADNSQVLFSALLRAPVTINAVGNVVDLTAILGWLNDEAYGDLDNA